MVEPERIQVALNPYVAKNGPGFTARAVETVRKILPEGFHETSWSYAPATDGPVQPGFALFGKEIDLQTALSMRSLGDAVIAAASALKPVFEAIQALGARTEETAGQPVVPRTGAEQK